jgi:predicted glutamine amidotransferase
MCRLLGFVARKPVAVASLLDNMFEAFVEVSHLHGDGWGLAWYDINGCLHQAKAPEPAHASAEFHHLAQQTRTNVLIGHVRWATPGFALCVENTHPFTREQFAFAHNGAIAPRDAIEEFIAPHLRGSIAGTTDSERHFLALLSALEKAPPIEAFRMHLGILHQRLHSSSLNCLLLTPEVLYAVCDFDPNAPLAQKEPDYFHLQYRITPGAVLVGSTGLNRGPGWKTLQNGQMLLVNRGTLKVEIVDVAQDTRSSIEEQYKSLLQR